VQTPASQPESQDTAQRMIETMPVKVNTGWIKEYEEDPHGMKNDH